MAVVYEVFPFYKKYFLF